VNNVVKDCPVAGVITTLPGTGGKFIVILIEA